MFWSSPTRPPLPPLFSAASHGKTTGMVSRGLKPAVSRVGGDALQVGFTCILRHIPWLPRTTLPTRSAWGPSRPPSGKTTPRRAPATTSPSAACTETGRTGSPPNPSDATTCSSWPRSPMKLTPGSAPNRLRPRTRKPRSRKPPSTARPKVPNEGNSTRLCGSCLKTDPLFHPPEPEMPPSVNTPRIEAKRSVPQPRCPAETRVGFS